MSKEKLPESECEGIGDFSRGTTKSVDFLDKGSDVNVGAPSLITEKQTSQISEHQH